MKLPLTSIIIRDRQRLDLGDCTGLAESLRETGQIQAIGVNERNELIWGRRRLEAATLLGWTEIEVVQRTGLTPVMEQEIEYEEDARRKDRTWQEKCLAIAKLKQIKEERTGETWTVRRMADFTGFSKSSVGYMNQVAAGLAATPKDEPLWACENYFDAIKLLLSRTHKQVNEELERRRSLFMAAALPPAKLPENAQYDPSAPATAEPVQALDTTPEAVTVGIHGRLLAFEDEATDNLVEGRASCVIGYNPSLAVLRNLMHIMTDIGFVILFFDDEQHGAEFFHDERNVFEFQPHALIWNRVQNKESQWPFSANYIKGMVMCMTEPSMSACRSSVISAAQITPGQLPPALIEAVITACCPDNMPVYCIGGVPPAAVAATGHTPLWYEPDPTLFDTYREELVAHYQETVPGVVIKDHSA